MGIECLGDDEKVPEMDSDDGCTTANVLNATKLHILKWLKN